MKILDGIAGSYGNSIIIFGKLLINVFIFCTFIQITVFDKCFEKHFPNLHFCLSYK